MHSDDLIRESRVERALDRSALDPSAMDPSALDLRSLNLDEVERFLAAGHIVPLPSGERAACVPPDDEGPCFSCEPHLPWPDEDGNDPA